MVPPGPGGGFNHSLGAPAAEAARDKDAVHAAKQGICPLLLHLFRIHPADLHFGVIRNPAVLQGLHHAEIGVMKLRILSRNCNLHSTFRVAEHVHQMLPVRKIRLRTWQMQGLQHHLRQMLFLHAEGYFIEKFRIHVLDDMTLRHIAEQCNLILDPFRQRIFRPAHQDIRQNPHPHQFADTGLGRLGLHLLGNLQPGNQRHMDHDGIVMADVMLKLPVCLKKGLRFDIARRAADLDDGDADLRRHLLFPVKPGFDLIGDMGNHLHRTSAVIPAALLVQHRPVDFSGSDIGILIQALINKALIMPQVQICLRAVIGHEHLPVLGRIHRSRVHIEVRVKLLHGHPVSPGL